MRTILQQDALNFLREFETMSLSGDFFTSIPDYSEISQQFINGIEDYKDWFQSTSELIFSKAQKFVIFLQTDIRLQTDNSEVVEFIDKSTIIQIAAKIQHFKLVWHKICIHGEKLDGRATTHKPNWSHLLCFSRLDVSPYDIKLWSVPDVFPRGPVVWSRGIGLHAAIVGLSFLLVIANSSSIIDPFCGQGTVLAVAEALGIPSIGCELSRKRCKKSGTLDLRADILRMGHHKRKIYGLATDLPYSLDDISPERKFSFPSSSLPVEVGVAMEEKDLGGESEYITDKI
jgi:hypothetical protein